MDMDQEKQVQKGQNDGAMSEQTGAHIIDGGCCHGYLHSTGQWH